MGGRRLVRVRNADDRATAACRQLLALDDQAGFVLLEAGELPAGSKLRRLVEGAPKAAAALPCYRPDERTLPAFVRETARESACCSRRRRSTTSPPTSAATGW
jgi:DNA polymerase-3 subunit delta